MSKQYTPDIEKKELVEMATMEKPKNSNPNWFAHEVYETHLASLTRIPAPFLTEEHRGLVMVEGKDFELTCSEREDWCIENCQHKCQRPKSIAVPITPVQEKPNCANHKTELFGHGDMKEVADVIGDLHYETLFNLLYHLSKKIDADSIKDNESGREKLAAALQYAGMAIFESALRMEKVWEISKPYMRREPLPTPIQEKEIATGKDKPFIVANVRDITDLYDREEISYSRMVEMLNEIAFKFFMPYSRKK